MQWYYFLSNSCPKQNIYHATVVRNKICMMQQLQGQNIYNGRFWQQKYIHWQFMTFLHIYWGYNLHRTVRFERFLAQIKDLFLYFNLRWLQRSSRPKAMNIFYNDSFAHFNLKTAKEDFVD